MAIGAVGIPAKSWVPPVGYVWTSGSSTSPASLFDGTSWTQIKDRFLIGAGEKYSLGSTGGSTTHTLSVTEMPAHSHSGSITAVGDHNHTIHDAGGTNIYNTKVAYGSSSQKLYTTVTVSFGTSGAHTHSVSIGNNGSGNAFNIMNPYVAKYMWRRVS